MNIVEAAPDAHKDRQEHERGPVLDIPKVRLSPVTERNRLCTGLTEDDEAGQQTHSKPQPPARKHTHDVQTWIHALTWWAHRYPI